MIAVLTAIFSSARIYLILGAAMLAISAFAYIEHLYVRAYKAEAHLASAEATINESTAALKLDDETIAGLKKANADASAALVQSAKQSAAVQDRLAKAKEAMDHVPLPKTCQALDARDRAALDGLRGILGGPATDR